MPKVGSKEFSYTKSGEKAADAEAKRTGQNVVRGYSKGGTVTARGSGAARKQSFTITHGG